MQFGAVFEVLTDEFNRQKDDTQMSKADKALKVKKIVELMQTEEMSASALLFAGNLVASYLEDDNYAYTFLERSFSKRAQEAAEYAHAYYPGVCMDLKWQSYMPLEQAFRYMYEYRYFSFHPNMKCEQRTVLTPKEFEQLTSTLYAFVNEVFYVNEITGDFSEIDGVNGAIRLFEYYSPLEDFVQEILLWQVFLSDNNYSIISSGEKLLHSRLKTRGMEMKDLTALVLPEDQQLFLALGNACWQPGNEHFKPKGFQYLWAAVKGTGLLPDGDEGVALLKDLFCKAKELDLHDEEKWAELARDMKRINASSGKEHFESAMIAACEERAGVTQ